MSRLGDKVEFLEAVPGSTVVLRLNRVWTKKEVSKEALARRRWSVAEIEDAWSRWLPLLPPEMADNFSAGKQIFKRTRRN